MAAWQRLMLAITLAAVAVGCESEPDPSAPLPVEIGGRTFELELALDEDTRVLGLSDRESLEPDAGMLFVFPRARIQQFVMRRCHFDIDIIFLGPNGRVVRTRRMTVEPPDTPELELKRYSSVYPAQFAIELVGGTLDEIEVRVDDKFDLPIEDLKLRAR